MDRFCRKCERNGKPKQEHFEFDCRFTNAAQAFAIEYVNNRGGDYNSWNDIPPRELLEAHDTYNSDNGSDTEEMAASYHIYPTDQEIESGNGRGGSK